MSSYDMNIYMRSIKIKKKDILDRFPIRVEIKKGDEELEMIKVTLSSPIEYKNSVYNCAKYLSLEVGLECTPYAYKGVGGMLGDPIVYSWVRPFPTLGGFGRNIRYNIIGSVCFSRCGNSDGSDGRIMNWIWIHPYFRRKNLLSKTWGFFQEEMGEFYIEKPLSRSMVNFLNKIKYPEEKCIGRY